MNKIFSKIKYLLKVLKKFVRYLKWRYFLYSGHYEKDTIYYVLKYGIGDTYLVSALLPYLKKGDKKMVLLIEKINQQFIPLMFDKFIEVKQADNLPYWLIAEFGHKSGGQPVVLHSDWVKEIPLTETIGYKGLTLIDVYKIMMGVVLDAQPLKPLYIAPISVDSLSLLNRYKKPILLCPQANSIATVSELFWVRLAEFLQGRDFNPVFMNASYDERFDTVSFPLAEAIEFCNHTKGVISLRSGFCDLISTSSSPKVILYPKINWYSGSLKEGSSLEAMQLTSDKLVEIEVVDFAKTDILFNQILTFLYE